MICDCELGHNGIGMAVRECDCNERATVIMRGMARMRYELMEQAEHEAATQERVANFTLGQLYQELLRLEIALDDMLDDPAYTHSEYVKLEAELEILNNVFHTRWRDCRYNSPSDKQIEEAWCAAAEALDDAVSDPATPCERVEELTQEFRTIDEIRTTRKANGDYSA